MKKKLIIILTLTFGLAGCAPHFHLDFLGKEKMAEVTLRTSPAKEKILLIDISGIITSSLKPGVLQREGDILSRVYYRLQKSC